MPSDNNKRSFTVESKDIYKLRAKRELKWILILTILIIFICLFIASNFLIAPTNKSSFSETTFEKRTIDEPLEIIQVEKTIDEQMLDIISKHFDITEDSFVNYSEYDETQEYSNFIAIRANAKDNLSSNLIKVGILKGISDSLKELQEISEELGADEIAFNITFPIVDSYGNVKNQFILRAFFPKTVRDKINWDHFTYSNIPNIAIDYWESPLLN